LNLLTIKDIYAFEPPAPLIEGFLYKQTLNLLTGYAGVGKSIFTLALAKSLTTGEPFLGHRVIEKGSVLIIDEENPKPFIRDRIAKFKLLPTSPLYYLHYQSIRVDAPDTINKLLVIVNKIKPILIVFDSLIRLHSASENDNSAMAQVMDKFREILKYINTTILLVHHDRKALALLRERVRGAGDILGAVDNQFNISEQDNGLILYTGKTRMIPIKPIRFKIFTNPDMGLQTLSGG